MSASPVPFAPVGGEARWRTLYPLLSSADIGDVLTYADLGEELGLDPVDNRNAIRAAFLRAAKEHEKVEHRAVEAVPNEGYRIVEPVEHLRLARAQQRRSTRALVRGRSKAVNVDMTGMDTETRHAFEVTARALSTLVDFGRRLDVRQSKMEEALAGMETRQNRSEDEIMELKKRLARLEGGR